MLAARGVSLGLGKINLSDLNSLPRGSRQAVLARQRRERSAAMDDKPKLVVKKRVDKQTLWAACRAVVFGTVLIVLGIVMAIIGYFDEALSTERHFNVTTQTEHKVINVAKRFQFKSLQYIGPVVMGVGSFILMIACVMTLESRDKHAQVIHEQAIVSRRSTKKTRPKSVTQHDTNIVTTDDEQRPLTSAERLPARSPADGGSEHAVLLPPSSERNNNFVHHLSNAGGPSDAGAANSSISHRSRDIPLYASPSPLPMLLKKDGDIEKFPSTSCIDDLSKRADTRALLQRFLDDQSRMTSEMERVTKDRLNKQSHSFHMYGSERIASSKRNACSDDTERFRHRTVAEVHQPPSSGFPSDSGNPATSSMDACQTRTIVPPASAVTVKRAYRRGYRSPGRAPIAAPDSLLDVANDSDSLEQFVSPMSTSPETTAAGATRVDRIPRRENHSSSASYATALSTADGDENANRANASFSPAVRLTGGNDNGRRRMQDTASNHISHFDHAHPYS